MSKLQAPERELTDCGAQLQSELEWLRELIIHRSSVNAAQKEIEADLFEILPPPDLSPTDVYSSFIRANHFSPEERALLILSLAPAIQPWLLDIFKSEKIPTAFGGMIGKNRAFLPTAETALFILAGNDVSKRLGLLRLFDRDHVLYTSNLLLLEEGTAGDYELNALLKPTTDLVDSAFKGHIRKPDLQPSFPAKLLKTEMSWEDMVLPASTIEQLCEIERWIENKNDLYSDPVLGKKIKPGFRALFYGPPGTGKTLSASLIGKKTGRDVYRIDLSSIVSKYIGETEKNLARLFDRASRKDWILFFDEADALFGKRTNVNDSHDRYANQEVSYLLQRVEYHEGLVVLATNLKNNVDSAFLRRFQSIVYFPLPKAEERLLLWRKAFSEVLPPDNTINLNEIAKKYELSGSLIVNIVAHSSLKALSTRSKVVTMNMLQEGIAREFAKEGRTI